ncbi:MAG: J domain-containing protein [Ardenticatenaceae bacterium]|nr:J domain-containing protein [Ardenticatenaceae bacterium]
MTLYDRLGVSPDADFAELRRAYRQAVRTWHPDRFATASPAARAQAEAEMRRINAAWDILGDPHHRRAYDATLWGWPSEETTRDGPEPRPAARVPDPGDRFHAGPLLNFAWLRRLTTIQVVAVLLLVLAVIVLQYLYVGSLLGTHLMTLVLVGSFFWWAGHLERG